MYKSLQCKVWCGNCYKVGQRKRENSEEELPSSWLDWDALGPDIAIMKAPAKVRLCRMMRISATRK